MTDYKTAYETLAAAAREFREKAWDALSARAYDVKPLMYGDEMLERALDRLTEEDFGFSRALAPVAQGEAEPAERAAEKQRSRDADAAALAAGEKTREQLREENSHFRDIAREPILWDEMAEREHCEQIANVAAQVEGGIAGLSRPAPFGWCRVLLSERAAVRAEMQAEFDVTHIGPIRADAAQRATSAERARCLAVGPKPWASASNSALRWRDRIASGEQPK